MAADPQAGVATIHAAMDAGINFFNTADFYNLGESERVLGEALKGRRREDAFISAKFGGLMNPNGMFYGIDNNPANFKSHLAYTLKRLGTDYVDFYQVCRINPHCSLEETMNGLAQLVKEGYVRHIGITEVDGQTPRL